MSTDTAEHPRRQLVPELLEPAQVAMALGISRKTVYLLVERGEIGCYRLGRRIRFSSEHVGQFLALREEPA